MVKFTYLDRVVEIKTKRPSLFCSQKYIFVSGERKHTTTNISEKAKKAKIQVISQMQSLTTKNLGDVST